MFYLPLNYVGLNSILTNGEIFTCVFVCLRIPPPSFIPQQILPWVNFLRWKIFPSGHFPECDVIRGGGEGEGPRKIRFLYMYKPGEEARNMPVMGQADDNDVAYRIVILLRGSLLLVTFTSLWIQGIFYSITHEIPISSLCTGIRNWKNSELPPYRE